MLRNAKVLALEERTARLTVLIDPRKKAIFEKTCAAEDVTPSQVVRRLIRDYLEEKLGSAWRDGKPDSAAPPGKRLPRR
jgi:Ribbon-helix-helix protein